MRSKSRRVGANFLICKVKIIIPTLKVCYEDLLRHKRKLRMVPYFIT